MLFVSKYLEADKRKGIEGVRAAGVALERADCALRASGRVQEDRSHAVWEGVANGERREDRKREKRKGRPRYLKRTSIRQKCVNTAGSAGDRKRTKARPKK